MGLASTHTMIFEAYKPNLAESSEILGEIS
jgi:hypothetical protein